VRFTSLGGEPARWICGPSQRPLRQAFGVRGYAGCLHRLQCNHCTSAMVALPSLHANARPSFLWVVTMYPADHQPPHFHVRMRDGREALIVIATLAPLTSSLKPRELADALAWAEGNRELLNAKWRELNP